VGPAGALGSPLEDEAVAVAGAGKGEDAEAVAAQIVVDLLRNKRCQRTVMTRVGAGRAAEIGRLQWPSGPLTV